MSYAEIRRRHPVAKSTLWRWLTSAGLVEQAPQRITAMKRAAQQRGAAAQHQKRLTRTRSLIDTAIRDVGTLSLRELWLIGVALYWAEGTKQQEHTSVSRRVVFSNMDANMMCVFLAWLVRCCHIDPSDITFEIYIHEHADVQAAKRWWVDQVAYPAIAACPIRLKRHKTKTRRQTTGDRYHGLLRVCVRRSTNLNRTISGWIRGIAQVCSLGSGVIGNTSAFGAGIPGSSPGSPVLSTGSMSCL
jgi:hypothetical protein